VKFFLLCIITGSSLIFPPVVAKSQTCENNITALADKQISPELEKIVRSTLRKSSLTLQLIENNGQLGLPESVAAYFSLGSQTVFIERDRLRIIVAKPIEKENEPGFINDKSSITARSKDYRYNTFNILFKGSAGFSSYEKIRPFATKRNFINARSS